MGFLDRFFGPPTEDKFAKIVMKALLRAGDDRTATYDKTEYRLLLTRDGEQVGVLNLRNIHSEYCNLPRRERSTWMSRTCVGLLNPMETPEDFEDVKPDLMPTVRTRSMLEVLRLDAEIAGDKPIDLPSLPLADELVICLAYDLPTTMKFITADDLSTWDVSLYEAAEVARQNLAERPFTMVCLGQSLFIMQSGDSYDGTRILLMDQIRRLELNGRPVAMPINRECLLITGSEDVAGLTLMAGVAEKEQGEARPLCPIPMLLVGDEWETWRLPPEHPAFDKFKELELRYLYGEYAEQKKLLDQRHEQLEQDIFVASFSAVERDEKLLSYCVWSKGVPGWLPKADFVCLFDHEANSGRFVAWDDLCTVVGDQMQPLDLHPARWNVGDFPSEEQISRMSPKTWSKDA